MGLRVSFKKGWAEHAYCSLIYYHELDKGGHFAAWEQPQLFSEESFQIVPLISTTENHRIKNGA
jgi:hypothetical protein